MSSTSSSPVKPEGDVPELRSLGPQFDKQLHGRHADVLLKVLSDQSASGPKNIALAGHYGSGKSSVILGVQEGLDDRGIEWVNLSLSSLGIDDTKRARVQEDGTLAPLTNLIQKEIVKQLLYRKAPKDMPGSRYFRIDSFRTGPALQWAITTAVGAFAIAVLLGLVTRVEKVAPAWLADGPAWAPWLAVALIGAFMGVVCFLLLRGLQNPVKVDSVSAGGAAVSLSAKENSYFDEYLDEIVYFFQQTKTKVAIFEDLDRFKDPHIFETLRELNTVLNHSEQVKARPVRFVYAVRDSIFEQLEVGSDASSDATAGDGAAADVVTAPSSPADGRQARFRITTLRASAQESAPSANRTKFFDLVVPMVPFLTHRSARDLLAEEFKDSTLKPSASVINLVGGDRALTDMRLIRNIRNEFEIYRASVLGDNGLVGLTADRLFAMMAYKNTHLEDFEAIRLGTSQIDAAHRAFRHMVEYQAKHQAARSRVALADARGADFWDTHAKAAGQQLQKVLPILHRANRNRGNNEPQLITKFGNYPMADLTAGEVWRKLHEATGPVEVGHPSYLTITVSFDELLALAGEAALGMKSAVEADATELRRVSREATTTKEFVGKATMAELMARTDLTMPVGSDGTERSLDEIVGSLVSPLAHDLLAKGLLDENFTLYCSDYQGVAISVSAMNFILHCVQADEADPLFRFDAPASIDAVENEVGDRFLSGESVFNVQVFDHYLSNNSERLGNALDRLVVRATAGATSFIDLYLEDETVQSQHRLVAELAPRWSGVFVHLAEATAPEQKLGFIDAAFSTATSDMSYQTSDYLVRLVEGLYPKMSAFAEPVDADRAATLVELIRALDIEISDLTVLGEAQRLAVVAAGLYPVTRANLIAALHPGQKGEDDISLELDVIKSRDANVYSRVVENLDGYLDGLTRDEVTVENPGAFLGVLADVASEPKPLVQAVAERAAEQCIVDNLADLDEAGWPAVVAANRFVTSTSNVSLYLGKHGITADMAQCLADHDLVDADAMDGDARTALAYVLVQASDLSIEDRVRLVAQLELPGYLEPSKLGADGLTALPDLLAAGEVEDTAESYASVTDQPYSFREKYFTSSSDLASYVTELPLSSDDLDQMMKSRRVGHAVKVAIAADDAFISARISRRLAITVGNWALKGNEVSPALILTLSQAEAPAEKILPLLEPHLPSIDIATLDAILVALGDDYEPLTRTGRHRPRLKSRPGTKPLLDELQRRNRVSSYGDAMLGGIKVNMRHE